MSAPQPQPQQPRRTPLGVKNVLPSGHPDALAARDAQQRGEALEPHKGRPLTPAGAGSGANAPLSASLATPRSSQSQQQQQQQPLRPPPRSVARLPAHSPAVLTPGASASRLRPSAAALAVQPISSVLTPKKRAVPQEEVHCRNVVQGDDARSESPSKRSRSSNTSSSTRSGGAATVPEDQAVATAHPSTGTSTGVSATFAECHVRESSRTAGLASGRTISTASASTSRGLSALAMPVAQRATTEQGQNPHPRPTTTRIDKHSRMSEAERAAREHSKKEANDEWRRRYLKAFPSFVFHFDALDANTKEAAKYSIERLGGRIEPFFSRSVTHLVTSRKIPSQPLVAASTPEISPQKHGAVGTAVRGALRLPAKLRSPAKSSRSKKSQPLHSDRNPFEDSGPPTASNDILVKAQGFGMKIWPCEKFNTMMASLLGEGFVAPAAAEPSRQNLSQMLKQERLHGTTETAMRSDYHYFAKQNCYVLVEDATGEHRAIIAQEYRRPKDPNTDPPWPKLHGEVEGRCPFTRQKLEIDKPTGTFNDHAKGNRLQTMRRSVSMGQVGRHLSVHSRGSASPQPGGTSTHPAQQRGASPYPMASGNSMAITSNVNSMTSTAIGSQGFGVGAMASFDKRVAQLGRRVLAPGSVLGASPLGTSASGGPAGSSTLPSPTVAHDSTAAADTHGATVRRMLGLTDQRGPMRRSVSTVSAGKEMRRITPEVKEKTEKPGYCENCRVKYDDFELHIVQRRHRKFATDSGNFVDLDELLSRVQRVRWSTSDYDGDADEVPLSPMHDLPNAPGAWQQYGDEDSAYAFEGDALPDDAEYTDEQFYAEYLDPSAGTTDEGHTSPQTSPDAERTHFDAKARRAAQERGHAHAQAYGSAAEGWTGNAY